MDHVCETGAKLHVKSQSKNTRETPLHLRRVHSRYTTVVSCVEGRRRRSHVLPRSAALVQGRREYVSAHLRYRSHVKIRPQ